MIKLRLKLQQGREMRTQSAKDRRVVRRIDDISRWLSRTDVVDAVVRWTGDKWRREGEFVLLLVRFFGGGMILRNERTNYSSWRRLCERVLHSSRGRHFSCCPTDSLANCDLDSCSPKTSE